MLFSLIRKSLIRRIESPYKYAIIYSKNDDIRKVANEVFVSNIFVLIEEFKNIKANIILMNGEKNQYCIEAIYACLLSGKAFVNVNQDQPQNRIEETVDQLGDYYHFPTKKIKDVINRSNEKDKDELKILIDKLDINNVDSYKNKVAYYMFTSGSTGIPKGVIISNKALSIYINYLSKELFHDKLYYKCMLSLSPLYFDNFIFDLATHIISNSTVCLFNMNQFVSVINTPNNNIGKSLLEQIDFVYAAPSVIKILMKKSFFKNISNFSKKEIFVGFGGEPFSWKQANDLLIQFNSVPRLVNFYGPTECTCMCSYFELDTNRFNEIRKIHEVNSAMLPIGRIFDYFNYLINITNKKESQGELLLGGECVMIGYLDNKHSPFIKVNGKKYFSTGDIVSMYENKLLYIYGRKDNQIKIKGQRIEIEEIESRISIYLKEENVLVIAISDRGFNRLILLLGSGISKLDFEQSISVWPNENLLLQKLSKILPSVMRVNDIFICNNFPLNQNGKINRNLITKMIEKRIHSI